MNQPSPVSESHARRAASLRPPFPVVGIGASAGGLTALQDFFNRIPADSGMAFVVVVHLSPSHESNLDSILQRVCSIPVTAVTASTHIEKNRVYVISPAMSLEMEDSQLRVDVRQRSPERHVAIDFFFRTLAEVHGTRAFAILMSGTGADGTLGMARVKEHGGVTFAQSPEEAEFDGMPRNAIDHDVVDFVLSVADMPAKLLEVWDNARQIEMPLDAAPLSAREANSQKKAHEAETALGDILNFLCARTGHDFKHYKRATVLRRIERRMQVNAIQDMPAYFRLLESDDNESIGLLGDMLIGVTNFFRDREAFELLKQQVIPELVRRPREPGAPLRVWTAACSTGEEAYSLAMMLTAETQVQGLSQNFQVFATDIDERAIAVARRGSYTDSVSADVGAAFLRQFFVRDGGRYRIKKELRDRILFASHNVLRDPPFSRLHLISCRNLLIYLDRRAQLEVLKMFHFALCPGGYLFLGTSETADVAEGLFLTVDKKNRIYRAKPVAGFSRSSALEAPRSGVAPILAPRTDLYVSEGKQTASVTIHQRALELYAPPSIIATPDYEIVHLSDGAGRFLRHVGGEPSRNLLALAHPQLRLELRSVLFRAIRTGKSVQGSPVPLERDGLSYRVNIIVRPFHDKEAAADFVLVVFDELESPQKAQQETVAGGGADDAIAHLEGEVQALKRQLQETIEHSDTSTEELKASNEELQAINEELRSATEELETSKEELQSMNEELVTVNFELKAKVEETAKINDDLRNLIASSDIATIFVDRSMRVKWYTPRAADLFSLIFSDKGRPLTDITHRLDYPNMMSDARETFDSLRLIEREVRSSDNRWFLARMLPYRSAEDRIEGAVLNFVDITELRAAEARSRADRERMRLVAESSTDHAIITLDEHGSITGWNRGAALIFGYDAKEVEGQPLEMLYTLEDRADDIPAREMRQAREQGHASDDRWHLRKDGTRFYCSGVLHPLVDGSLLGYAKIARDLTDKLIEEYEQHTDLERTRADNLAKDEFFAVMSHELRHPLNLIQLNVDLLARLPPVTASPLAAKAVDAVRRSVRSQSQIIEDLLDLSRVRTGKLKLERHSVNLGILVAGILEAIGPEAASNDIAVIAQGLDEAAAPMLYADPTRVEQIVWNLLNNAIKFTPAGGTVQVTVATEGGMARLDVKDTGIGIATTSLAKVFDMFAQVESQHTVRNRNGLGIGLSLVAQLVAAHEGRVEAASDGHGLGSNFTVWLPLQNAQAESADKPGVEPGLLEGVRILLVDDSDDVRETLSALCEMEGAVTMQAGGGATALALLAEQDFDVLVSDLGMPGMDGYELLAALRKGGRNARLPAIALSGYGENAKAREVGFVEQLCKPVPIDELIDKLRQLAQRG
jgi:two-component system CheB/CheR fusion protein